jgi:hypothetical protein
MKYWTSKSTGQEAVVNPRKGFVKNKKSNKKKKIKKSNSSNNSAGSGKLHRVVQRD